MKLSTRKKLTIGLGVSCALLALFAVLQKFQGIGRGYELLPVGAVSLDASVTAPLKQSENHLQAQGLYAEIDSRSLFTQDRKAMPKVIITDTTTVKPAIPVVPLNAQLIGVVMTPTKKVAILRSAGGDQTFRLKEGMPFPGELAGWKVLSIEARKVTFDGDTQGKQELKLDVARGGATAGPGMMNAAIPNYTPPNPNAISTGMPNDANRQPVASMPMPGVSQPGMPNPVNPGGFVQPPPPPPPTADQAAREAEVQRIIEERRAQMRAEAERLNSGKN